MTTTPLLGMELTNPVVAAPMAGGPSTPALVAAASAAGGFGFLAAGYKTVESLAEQIGVARASTQSFGVNLFAPNPVPVDPSAYRAYAGLLQEEAARYGLDLTAIERREDDDGWEAKVALLLEDPVPVVSFTFGLPEHSVVAALRRAGSTTLQTVTSVDEALLAADAGVDGLIVQGHEAGGHYATFTPGTMPPPAPLTELVQAVRARTGLPVLAAGGLTTSASVKGVLSAGASAAMVGTFLLHTDESGASAAYRAALAARPGVETVVTRAFTGRPARAVRNLFVDRFDAASPLGYPAVHHLTAPLRRAAADAGDAGLLHLWAGTGHASAPTGPAAGALHLLGAGL